MENIHLLFLWLGFQIMKGWKKLLYYCKPLLQNVRSWKLDYHQATTSNLPTKILQQNQGLLWFQSMFLREGKPIELQKHQANHILQELHFLTTTKAGDQLQAM